MASLITEHQQWFDSTTGELLVNGNVYIGTVGLDPEDNLITIYSDRALTTPIANPQTTDANGQTTNKIWIPGKYSITVTNSADVNKYTELDNGDINPDQGIKVASIAALLTVNTVQNQFVTVLGFNSVGDNGGGRFYWSSTTNKNTHNGGLIISNTVPLTANLQEFLDGTNDSNPSGTGCWLRIYSGNILFEWFGTDGTRANDSIAIRSAVSAAAGNPISLLINRYFYDGATIEISAIRIHGSGMPQVNSGKTALENGSIIDGTFAFICNDAEFKDFGVDVGSGSAAADGDALRVSATTLNAGGHLHTQNIVGLCKTSSVAYHALLFQSFLKHTGDNLHGIYGLFGFVSKCQNVDLGLIHTIENDESGVLLKSDTGFGRCGDVSIQRVICDCSAAQKRGFHVQSSDAPLRDVQIGIIKSDGAEENVLLQCGASGIELRNISIDTILSKNSQSKDLGVDCISGTASIFNVNVGKLVTEGTQIFGIRVIGNGDTDDLNIESAFINYATGITQAVMNDSCFIGGSTTKSRIGDLTILLNFTTAQIGGITYSNLSDTNVLGSRVATVYGAGITNGLSEPSLTGTGNSVTIPVNVSGDSFSIIRATPTATGVEVDEFVEAVTGADNFVKGHRLVILNNSLYAMDVLHGPSNGIYNTAGATKTIAQNESATWVHGGSDVWHGVT